MGRAQRRRNALDLNEHRRQAKQRQLQHPFEYQTEDESGQPELESCLDTDCEPSFEPSLEPDFESDLEDQSERNTSSCRPELGSWASLAPELRNHILDLASFQIENPAKYVTVSREWQPWFERETFRSLEIHSENYKKRVHEFERKVRGQKAYRWEFIRNIKFNIYLKTSLWDTTREWNSPESRKDAESNSQVFTNVMVKFLKVLAVCPEWCRINLELCISSPKDCRGNLKQLTELGALERHLGCLLELRTSRSLPRAPAVKGLVIRKEFHRQMSPRCLARLFNQSFVNTECFTLMRRCRISEDQTEIEYMRDFRDILIPALPSNLRKFFFHSSFAREEWVKQHARYLLDPDSLSEHCSSFYDFLRAQDGRFTTLSFSHPALIWPSEEGYSASHPRLIWSGEDRKLNLFLAPRFHWDERMFRDMEQIWLRAPLRIAQRSGFLDQILTSAASLAACMPKLRMMGLWTDKDGLGRETLFQYITDVEDGKPMIHWASQAKKKSPFSNEVIASWKNTAAKHNNGRTELLVSSMHTDKIKMELIWQGQQNDDAWI